MYKCNTGFSLEGSIVRTCLPTGQLSGTTPKCESDLFLLLILLDYFSYRL